MTVSLPLALLSLRRVLPPAAVLILLLAGWAVARGRWDPPQALVPLLETGVGMGGASALARQGVWTALLALAAPLLVFRSAAVVPAWRRGEVHWLAASPATRLELYASTWLGLALACLMAISIISLSAEAAAGRADAGWQRARALPVPDVVLAPLAARATFTLDPGTSRGALLRVHVQRLSGAPGGEVRLSLARGSASARASAMLAGATSLTLPLPAGDGPLTATLECDGEAAVALDGAVEVLVPVGSERRASFVLALRASLALWVACALALGLGACVSAPSAAMLVLSTALLTWLRGTVLPVPWADLPFALATVGEGIAPDWPGALPWTATLLLVALGALFFTHGLRGWRRAP